MNGEGQRDLSLETDSIMTGRPADHEWTHDLSLSDSDSPPTPGRGISLKMTGGTGTKQVQQVIVTSPPVPARPRGIYSPPGRFVPQPRRVITCMAGRQVPRGKDAPRRPPKIPPAKQQQQEADISTAMRNKGTPRKTRDHVPEKSEKEESRGRKRKARPEEDDPLSGLRKGAGGRVTLPPRDMAGTSDDESWFKDGEFYTTRLEEDGYGRSDNRLTRAQELVGEAGPCPFVGCPTKVYTRDRYRRHLVEVHTERTPLLGCRDDASCAERGKGFKTSRRGDLVRHLVATHAIGAEKAIGYIRALVDYPDRDNRPKDAFYPKHLFYRTVANLREDRVRWAEEGVAPTPTKGPSAAVGSATPTLDEAAMDTGAPKEPTPSTSKEAPGTPPPPPRTPSPVVSLAEVPPPSSVGYRQEDDPVSAEVSRTFMGYYDRATAQVIAGFQEAVRKTRKEASMETEEWKSRCATLEQRVREQAEELKAAQEQIATLKKENRRASRLVEKSEEYKDIQLKSLEGRLSRWDKAFAAATGVSLHDWTGSRRALREALQERPDSDED